MSVWSSLLGYPSEHFTSLGCAACARYVISQVQVVGYPIPKNVDQKITFTPLEIGPPAIKTNAMASNAGSRRDLSSRALTHRIGVRMNRYPKSGKGASWTNKELVAIGEDWKGDTLSDGRGLSGEVPTLTINTWRLACVNGVAVIGPGFLLGADMSLASGGGNEREERVYLVASSEGHYIHSPNRKRR